MIDSSFCVGTVYYSSVVDINNSQIFEDKFPKPIGFAATYFCWLVPCLSFITVHLSLGFSCLQNSSKQDKDFFLLTDSLSFALTNIPHLCLRIKQFCG